MAYRDWYRMISQVFILSKGIQALTRITSHDRRASAINHFLKVVSDESLSDLNTMKCLKVIISSVG